ncbi:MAG: fibronectin type III domain-containing protein [Nocardioidaceae bacterium]
MTAHGTRVSSTGSRRWTRPRTTLGGLTVVTVLAVLAALLGAAPASAASTCQDTTSSTGGYTVRVCLTEPADGATLTGPVSVTGTVSTVSGTVPGVQRMVYSLDGQYLLTDYQSPYTFTLDTRRFVDGAHTLALHALLRDTSVTNDTTINVSFNNGITTPPVNTKTFTPPQGNPVGPGQTFTVAAAGDGAGGESSETAVTNLIASMNPNLTLYLGDVYEKGTPTEYDNWYGLSQPTNTFYGRFRDITLPTIGNHEYTAGQAPGYFDYWDNTPHYYSVDRNGWHIVSLDTNSAFNQTAVGTPQYTWLQNDLQNNTQPCTLVFYHQPRFNIGDEGPSTYLDPIWSLMAQNGVDLVINGHDHTYQRYVPLDGAGNPSATGVTEIINGAGGHALGGFPGSDTRLAATAQQFGALKLGLNSAGAAYQFVTTSGTTLDSGSAKCDATTADTVSPTAPTNLTATSTYKTKIDLSWTPSTDDVGVTRYRIFRDGALLDTISAASSYSDTTVTPGSTHSYQVRALDDAGNVSGASNTASATTPTVAVLFHDGFETGDMSNWTNPGGTTNPPNSGLTVQSNDVFAGTYAARALSASGTNGASAWKTLAQSESDLYYEARFKVNSHSSTVNLLRMRNGLAASSPIVTAGLSATNRLTLRNDAGATPATVSSTTSVSPGTWHTLQLHAVVNGTSSSTEVWLDGTKVPDLSLATVDLGANPVAKVELGDPGSATSAKTFDVDFDEVALDRQYIGDLVAPAAPTNLTATAHSGLAVDLAWTAATDDVGVSGYDVYRNGSLLTSIGASTSYRDTTVSPNTGYTYKLVARDAAGNASGYSNSATVQTSDVFADGFESGDLTKWSSVNGLTVSQQEVDTGTWAARATSDGTAGASAQAVLDAGINDVYYRVRFKELAAPTNNVNLLRFRNPTNGAMVTAFVSSLGKVGYRNDLAGTTTTSTTSVSAGVWHELQAHVKVAGDSSLVELWLDGVLVSSKTEPLGTSSVGRLELGDTSTGRTFDIAFDNVVASTAFVTDAQAPTAPTNLQASNIAKTSVDLSWGAASDDVGVVGYRVYRNGAGIADLDGSTTSYTDATASDSTTYTYKVTALDAVGHESPASNSVSVTTLDGTKPTAPTNLTASAVAGANQVKLAWSAATDNTGVTGYRIYRSDLTQPLDTIGNTLSYTDSTVSSSTSYTYRVTALDAQLNESDPSAPATVTSADTVAPSAPGGVTASPASDVSATVTWTAATDAVGVAGYDVYRNGAATPVGSVNGSTLTFTDTALQGDTTYSYTVKARDAAGNASAASAPASVTTWVFADGFETGNLSRWDQANGLVVQSTEKFSGTYGARAPGAKGNPAQYAVKNLPSTYTDLFYDVHFKIISGKSTDTDMVRFRTATGANVLALYYTGNKRLAYLDDVTGNATISTTSIPVGAWQQARVEVKIAGTSSTVKVWFNGSPVAALTRTDNLGTAPIGRIVAGESTAGHSFDYALDDVRVTRTP